MWIIFKATDKEVLPNWNTAVIWVSQKSQVHRGNLSVSSAGANDSKSRDSRSKGLYGAPSTLLRASEVTAI